MLALACFLICAGQSQPAGKLTVCIDPGHPSEVSQGTSGRKVTEMHVAWVIAKRLEKALVGRHVNVVLTKHSEHEYVKNKDRSMIANKCHADIYLRLHCDASNGTGFATYYPDQQGTTHGFTGPDHKLIKTIAPIAKRFHVALAKDLKGFLKDNGLMSDTQTAVGSKLGALTGSIYSRVPVVLVEMCVLTNRKDEAKVISEAGQKRLTDSLADAVMAAIGVSVPPTLVGKSS